MAMETAEPDSQLSSYVWICTSTHAASTVTVIDAKNPSEVLDSFPVCQTHLLCICSVQGALEKDYALLENSEVIKSGETLEKPGDGNDEIGRVEFVRVEKSSSSDKKSEPVSSENNSDPNENISSNNETDDMAVNNKALTAVVEDIVVPPHSPIHLNHHNNNSNNNQNVYSLAFPKPVNPILGSPNPLCEPAMSSVGPTMWLGAQSGMLYVHSSVARWRDCLHQVSNNGVKYIRLKNSFISDLGLPSRRCVIDCSRRISCCRCSCQR